MKLLAYFVGYAMYSEGNFNGTANTIIHLRDELTLLHEIRAVEQFISQYMAQDQGTKPESIVVSAFIRMPAHDFEGELPNGLAAAAVKTFSVPDILSKDDLHRRENLKKREASFLKIVE